MPIYEQIPLRFTLRTVSNPPITPLDANTGQTPKFWRSQTAAIAVGVFDAQDAPVTLSNLARLELILQKTEDDDLPLVVKTVLPNDPSWRNTVTSLGWVTGLDQNAVFVLDPADTDQSLEGQAQAEFWVIIRGVTNSGGVLIYGAGPVEIYNASNALPLGPVNYVSFNEQTTDEGDITITPTSQQHTEVLNIEGASRTSNVLLGVNGVVNGAKIEVLLFQPEAAGVVIQFRSQLISNPVLYSFSSDAGVTRSYVKFYFADGYWHVLNASNPAY